MQSYTPHLTPGRLYFPKMVAKASHISRILHCALAIPQGGEEVGGPKAPPLESQ